jgi:iron complex outermembrane receptor protein
LARLPAGELEGVLGAEYDGNTFHTNLNVGSNPYGEISSIATYHRTEYAVFGEVRAPLIPKPGRSGSLVEVTASGRYDHYSDFAGDGTEQFGIEVEPARGLLLRASYGTAFAAPTLQQLYSPQTVTENVGIDDPVNGQFYLINLLTGGNPSLRPLTGRSRTVGIIYSVPAIRDLLLSITQWDVQEDNEITAFPDQLIVDNPMLFPGRGIRDAAGKILEIDDTNANFGSIDVAGVDYQVDYKLSLGGGIASIQLGATETYRYQQALLPSSPPVDAVSIAQSGGNWAPRWRGTIGVGWTGDSLTARVSGRYVGSYEDYGTTQEIGNFWILDTDWRWPLGKLLHSRECWSRGAYVEFGGTNLLNRAPQFSNYLFDTVGFDMSQASIVGRSLYVNVGVDW